MRESFGDDDVPGVRDVENDAKRGVEDREMVGFVDSLRLPPFPPEFVEV